MGSAILGYCERERAVFPTDEEDGVLSLCVEKVLMEGLIVF